MVLVSLERGTELALKTKACQHSLVELAVVREEAPTSSAALEKEETLYTALAQGAAAALTTTTATPLTDMLVELLAASERQEVRPLLSLEAQEAPNLTSSWLEKAVLEERATGVLEEAVVPLEVEGALVLVKLTPRQEQEATVLAEKSACGAGNNDTKSTNQRI